MIKKAPCKNDTDLLRNLIPKIRNEKVHCKNDTNLLRNLIPKIINTFKISINCYTALEPNAATGKIV